MTAGAGQGMASDIAEQPEVFARLLAAPHIAPIAERIRQRQPRQVIFTARGTSDHAALYAAYLTEIRLGIPAGLASPSAITVYGARPDLRDCLVVGVSQSGGSPDLAEVLRVGRERGALTLAVTNAPDSPLATTADLHLDVQAGPERAVAATKTYTAELLALYRLIESIAGGGGDEVSTLPELAARTLADAAAREIASRYRFADRVITTGRGYAYPTARECALKLMETSYLAGLAFSGADLLHGPLAMADRRVPVLAIVGDGPAGRSMAEVLDRLRSRGADLMVVGSSAHATLRTPDVDERIAPMLDILPLQRLALELALARGEDPDAPRGLLKVTATL
jgi:glucosamine--fructose-6-phosphate aminotransferase (isomerizing)